ncbi:MAG: enoyl-CoA hydratase/isomerase family protein [Pseudomonadales bacterium]
MSKADEESNRALEDRQWQRFRVTRHDHWLRVRIAAPPMNLIDWPMLHDLDALSRQLEQESTLSLVSFESDLPGYFIAHADLNLFLEPPPEDQPALSDSPVAVFMRFRRLPQLTVAGIAGRAIGGGLEFALAMDLVAADKSLSKMGFFEGHLGTVPGAGGTWAAPERVGRGRALYLLLAGEELDAETAERFGLIDHVVEPGGMAAFLERLAGRVAALPAPVVAQTKELVTAHLAVADVDAAAGRESAAQRALESRLPGEARRRMQRFLSLGGQDPAWEAERMADMLPRLGDG